MNKNRTKCFTSALGVHRLAWEWVASVSMMHSPVGENGGSSSLSESSLAPARCPRSRTQKQRTQCFNKSPFSEDYHSRKGFVVGLKRVRLVFLQWSAVLPNPSTLRPLRLSKETSYFFPPSRALRAKAVCQSLLKAQGQKGAHLSVVAMLLV